jgi:hypothetical protein
LGLWRTGAETDDDDGQTAHADGPADHGQPLVADIQSAEQPRSRARRWCCTAALGALESPGSTRTGGLDWEDWIQQRRHDSWAMSVQAHGCDSGEKSAGPLKLEDWCMQWAIGDIMVDIGVSHLSDRRPQLAFGCKRARGLSDPIIVGTDNPWQHFVQKMGLRSSWAISSGEHDSKGHARRF